jgi:hypothetical protein
VTDHPETADSTVKSRLHPVSVAVGLITAGLAALIVACWVLDKDFSDAGPGSGWTQALTIAIAVGAVAVLALRNRPVAWCLVVAGLAVTVLSVIGFIAQDNFGFPGKQTVLAAVGGLAVTVGAFVLSLVPAGRWRRPSVASGLFGLVALLLVPAAAWPLLTITPTWRLTATTASPGEPAAVPGSVSKVSWSAEVDGKVKEVVAAGMGFVVMFADGAAGVDGTTGQVRWSRRRDGAETERIEVSPDGRTVMLQISPAGRLAAGWEVLDAITGELRFATDIVNGVRRLDDIPMTNVSYVGVAKDESVFHGYSLIDGRKLWDYPIPAGCRVIGDNSDQIGQANGLLLPLACGEQEFRYVSVDGTTGRPRWQHVVTLPPQWFSTNSFVSENSPDHKLVRLGLQGSAEPDTILDTDSGTVLSTSGALIPRDYGLGLAGKPENLSLVDIRNRRTILHSGAAFDCVLSAKSQLSGGALCPNPDAELVDKTMVDGTVGLVTARFDESAVTPITVKVGGPFDVNKDGSHPYVVVPGPGAVVVYSDFGPVDGVRYRLIGLT